MKESSGPKPIKDLFAAYRKRIKAPEQSVIAETVVVIEELLGLVINEKQISYTPHSRTLYIKNGMLKSELQLHKKEILNHLQGRLGTSSAPHDIL